MTRPRRRVRRVALTRFRLADVAFEAFDSVVVRPGRAALTMLGTVLGTWAFVAVLGLTTTASHQISAAFTAQVATQVTVTDAPSPGQGGGAAFPAGTERRLRELHGVRGAGEYWAAGPGDAQITPEITVVPPGTAGGRAAVQLGVTAATPGYLRAIGARLSQGRLYGEWQQDTGQPVCVLGAAAARQLGISDVAVRPAVYIDGTPVTVIGVVSGSSYQPQTADQVLVPTTLAIRSWGRSQASTGAASVLIVTRLGAAAQVGAEAPYAINPADPGRYRVTVPPNPDSELAGNVSRSLETLFYTLAGVCLLVGASGIANATLVAELERVKEIGLRRTFGARRRHILAQFLAEATALGLVGGILGAVLGAGTVLAVAAAQHWTAIISPVTVLPAPLAGGLIGLLAGAYPAWRASRIQAVDALRTQ